MRQELETLIDKYLRALINKDDDAEELSEEVLAFLNENAFEDCLMDTKIFIAIRVLYKHVHCRTAIRRMLVKCEPILIDLSKSKVVDCNDLDTILDHYAVNHLRLPECFVEKYRHQLCQRIFEMANNLEDYSAVIENVYIYYPELCLHLESKDVIDLLNRKGVSLAFMQKIIEELSSEKITHVMKSFLTRCLARVTNHQFIELLSENENLLYKARSCIYDENTSPRDNYARFDFSGKNSPTIPSSAEEILNFT